MGSTDGSDTMNILISFVVGGIIFYLGVYASNWDPALCMGAGILVGGIVYSALPKSKSPSPPPPPSVGEKGAKCTRHDYSACNKDDDEWCSIYHSTEAERGNGIGHCTPGSDFIPAGDKCTHAYECKPHTPVALQGYCKQDPIWFPWAPLKCQ